jgi:hypothetical protein
MYLDEGDRRTMRRLLPAVLTSLVAAALAFGTALGMIAVLNAPPEQPNVPLVTFDRTGDPPTSRGAGGE